MNRRFFQRVDITANGELLWATKSRLGRVKNHREYITTINVSIDGAKIVVPGRVTFPTGARARLKLGIEFCDVDVLESSTNGNRTIARVTFVNPSRRFVSVVEKWIPEAKAQHRDRFTNNWV